MRKLLSLCVGVLLFTGCATSSHDTQKSSLGTPRPFSALEAVIDAPGTVTVETIASSDWEADRGGLINLQHPRAQAAGLTAGPEPVQVYFHVLKHPTQGTFLIETGVERAMRDAPTQAAFGAMADSLKGMKFNMPLGDWLAQQKEAPRGVFLTHLHFDHISGMADVPAKTAVYMGPGELASIEHADAVVREGTQRALQGKGSLQEWAYEADAAGRFAGVVDVFGDGSVWALWVPGHTPGSTAYLVRTPQGPVLFTGDACHTRWGWEHDVEPGTFSEDIARSAGSLAQLRRLVAEHPAVDVRFGHQR
ncbi:MBL fold metallo-hydrolase [Stigmatella erecta]|uniref:Metallo-beta-lactamase superfamily protein n=1 Tax=Stigmatella erecta TaxID=83460 RepID=A0A1I0JE14_9BACT|nr:MBL fold metallo-hydrolase [Stigmatella erecta]SEU08089.1 Metallo-beta-lactamase superfamily protein [Stigmatella erecta]